MSNSDSLFSEVKGDLEQVAEPLLSFAADQVQKHGAFLPFGAPLSSDGDLELEMAAPEQDETSSEEVLPLLHAGLQQVAKNDGKIAVAVAEWVKITPEGEPQTDAIKVHTHHQRGLAIAFYAPATKKFMRGWQFGEMFAIPAEPIISDWKSQSRE